VLPSDASGTIRPAPTSTVLPPLLAGKVCLVSGAGPGLGRQTALLLAAHGADVVLAARRRAYLEELAAEVEARGGRALVAPTDISDPAQCERAVALATDELGGIDVLVNNAFRFDVFKTFEAVDLDVWRKIVDVNLFGTLQMTKAALEAMRLRGGGSVVIVASMAARRPPALQGGYAISKGALLTATPYVPHVGRGLRPEYHRRAHDAT